MIETVAVIVLALLAPVNFVLGYRYAKACTFAKARSAYASFERGLIPPTRTDTVDHP